MTANEREAVLSRLPALHIDGDWTTLLGSGQRADLEAILPAYIQEQRWFGAKARGIASAQIIDIIALSDAKQTAYFTLVRLVYGDGGSDTYALPVSFAPLGDAERLLRDLPRAVIARVETGEGEGILFDALFDTSFCALLLDLIADRRSVAGETGALQARPTAKFEELRGEADALLTPKVGTAEQSNTSIIFGGRLIMKLFRKLEFGINPDLEIGRFLTEQSDFRHVPPAAGTIEYRGTESEPASLAFLQGFVPNQGDAWSYTLREIVQSFKGVLTRRLQVPDRDSTPASLLDLANEEVPQQASEVIGGYLDAAALLGRRTGELHRALGSNSDDPDFAPEPFDDSFRRTLAASMRGRAEQAFRTLQTKADSLAQGLQSDGQQILAAQEQFLQRLQDTLERPFTAMRTRIHGDYHLGQVLATGEDFFIIDFEGEPARPLRERRVKSSPLQDVAGMLRSFHYAPYAVLLGQAPDGTFTAEEVRMLEPWARYWHRYVSATFLRSYLATVGQASFVPSTRDELQALLDLYLLDKALYELAYELNNRPTWVRIPIEGILQLGVID